MIELISSFGDVGTNAIEGAGFSKKRLFETVSGSVTDPAYVLLLQKRLYGICHRAECCFIRPDSLDLLFVELYLSLLVLLVVIVFMEIKIHQFFFAYDFLAEAV